MGVERVMAVHSASVGPGCGMSQHEQLLICGSHDCWGFCQGIDLEEGAHRTLCNILYNLLPRELFRGEETGY
jgi:hypothetical protein